MTHYCDSHKITGLTDEADTLSPTTREHIEENASLHTYAAGAWLPGVYSEDDDALRDALVADLGKPVASGPMSEECGWDVTDYVAIVEV